MTILKTGKEGAIEYTVTIIECELSGHWFTELYKESEHIAGTTIKSLVDGGHYLGQYKPSDLAKEYAKQGKENASALAYESLQKELAEDQTANRYYMVCETKACGVMLSETTSMGFAYSWQYSQETLKERASYILSEDDTFISDAIKEAKQTLGALKRA